MKTLIRVLFALMTLAASSPASAQNPTPEIPRARQELLPGDQIRITVWRSTEFSGDYLIAANGTITHPLYREVQVTGIPLASVEERLRVFLSRYMTNPQFVIEPLVRIIVAGEVRSPNIYSVPPETTIAQALALAGGANDRGQIRDVRVIRDRQMIRMDVSKADSDAAQLQIRSGDQIFIGRRPRSAAEIISPVTSTIAAAAGILSLILR
jgi:polysaccharide export outer membrane protein